MPRIRTWTSCWVFALGIAVSGIAGAVEPSENLLPATTRGLLSVADVRQLSEHWNKTQLGKLIQDPVMKPFATDLRHQIDQRWSGVRERLGLSLDDLRGVPAGEFAVALVQPSKMESAMVLLMDVTGHQKEATELLKRQEAKLAKEGATKRKTSIQDADILVFDQVKEKGKEDLPAPQVFYYYKNNLFVAVDHRGTLDGILGRLAGKKTPVLSGVVAFDGVMKRCQKDVGKGRPQVRWYIEPIPYADTVRHSHTDQGRRKGKTMLEVFSNQGFGAIQGVGGYVDFSVDKYEIFHRTAVWAPKPYEKAMKMMVFPNQSEFVPFPWVPREVANYSSFYCDVLNAFDNFGQLFDEMYGQGETGVWDQVLEGLEKDPEGPKIDLRKEIVSFLKNRVTIVTDYELPITTTSERILVAIEAKDEQAVARALSKLFKNDKEMRRRECNKFVVWESVPPEKAAIPTVSLELPGMQQDGVAPKPPASNRQDSLFPNAAMTAAHGHLLIASHYDFMKKVLQKGDVRESLARSVDYQQVDKVIKELHADPKCLRVFSRTDEQYRPTYELIRQGKMPESETMFGRVLNTMAGAGKKGVFRKQEIDGKQMPDYEFVRRFLGPAGGFSVSEEKGWFLKGFLLPKGS